MAQRYAILSDPVTEKHPNIQISSLLLGWVQLLLQSWTSSVSRNSKEETPMLYSKIDGWQFEERHAKACLSSLLRELSIIVQPSSNNHSTLRKNITAESSAICPSLLCSPVYIPTCNSSTSLHIEGNAGSQLPVLLLEYLPGSQK